MPTSAASSRSHLHSRLHSRSRRRMIQRVRRQANTTAAIIEDEDSDSDSGDEEEEDTEGSENETSDGLSWTSSTPNTIAICSDYTLSWAAGSSAKLPFTLTAQTREASPYYTVLVAKDITDTYYTWTVNSPINTTVALTLQDAEGKKLDSPSDFRVVSSGLGKMADTWCMVSNNAAQQGSPSASSTPIASSSTVDMHAPVTIIPGADNSQAEQIGALWAELDRDESIIKKAHAATGALGALFTLAIILGLIGLRMHLSLRKEYKRLVQVNDADGDGGTVVDMSSMEKRGSLLSKDDLAFALDRTPSQISSTSTDIAAQRRGSDNPFLDSSASSDSHTPRTSNSRFSYISNATSRITGVSNISNEYYHRTKASTMPSKSDAVSTMDSMSKEYLRPSSASTITSSSTSTSTSTSSSSRNITAPNAALKKYSHWSATTAQRSPSAEEYLTETYTDTDTDGDRDSSRRESGSTVGLSRVDSRSSSTRSFAAANFTIIEPTRPLPSAVSVSVSVSASASRVSQADSFQRALGRL